MVLTIGDLKISAAEFEKIMAYLPPQYRANLGRLGKKGFAERYGNLRGMALEGEKRNIGQSEEFTRMLEFQRLLLLAQVTLNNLVAPASLIPAEEVKEFYESHQSDFEQVKLRGIYIPYKAGPEQGGDPAGAAGKAPQPQLTQSQALAKAKALGDRIRSGEDMAALAKAESRHPTAPQSGDFGYVRRNQLAPGIASLVFALEPSQVSDPAQDRNGFFIFRVEERRLQPPEEARPIIENSLRQQKIGAILTKVQNDYPVTLNPSYFTESAPAVPAPQASPQK